METRATPSVARRLVEVLPETAARGRRQWQPTGVLLLALALVSLGACSAASVSSGCPAGCDCKPGGERVFCVGLASIPRFLPRSTKTLRISQHRITTVSKESLRGLEHLETLEISGGRLSEISDDAFSSLTQLKVVNVSNNELTVLPRGVFSQCPQLRQLDLSRNALVLPRHSPMLASESLSALDLSFCHLRKLPDKVFSELPALSELRMRGNNLHHVSECVLEPVRQLILLDVDPAVEWTQCSVQETTTTTDQQRVAKDVTESGPGSSTPQPTGVHFLQSELIPTLPQLVFLVASGIFIAWLLSRMRDCFQTAGPRKEHVYDILGGNKYYDFKTSSIQSHTYETLPDVTRSPLFVNESHVCNTPNDFRPVPPPRSQIQQTVRLV